MSARPLVVMTDPLSDGVLEKQVLGDVADVQHIPTTHEDAVARYAGIVNVLLITDLPLQARTMAALKCCRAIVRSGVGIDSLDLQAAGRHGIIVCNVPDYGTEEVADHALLLLLAIARRLVPLDQAIRAGTWDPTMAFGAPRLRGKTLGIVGCGRIGTAMARRARALDMRIVFYDPYQPDGYEKALGIERCKSLEELLPQAQFLSLHCPLTAETHHLLDAKKLALLPGGAYVVNTARGPCIDQRALVSALETGQVAAAGLDVAEREPLDDDALRRHPRVVLTPHSAFYSVEGFIEMRVKGAQEAKRILSGEAVYNPVNLEWLTSPRCVLPLSARRVRT